MVIQINLSLLCCPVLVPHMTGEDTCPGEETENVSEVQSPMAALAVLRATPSLAAAVVPTTGPAIIKV